MQGSWRQLRVRQIVKRCVDRLLSVLGDQQIQLFPKLLYQPRTIALGLVQGHRKVTEQSCEVRLQVVHW